MGCRKCIKTFDDHTPKFTINNMTVGELQIACKLAEPWWYKIIKLLSGLITLIVAIMCTVYFT